MTKKTIGGLVVVAVIVVGLVVILLKGPSGVPVTNLPSPLATSTPGANLYTMAEVTTHNSGQSCWTAIAGQVYDLTTWINQHPGGSQAILSLCGTDGTAGFTAQHGGQARPATELKSFLLGALQS